MQHASVPDTPAFEVAPAKVNLYLHVTGRRPDGYHLLDSLVGFADIGDRLRWDPSGPLRLTVTGPFADAVPDDDGNLALRALSGMARVAGVSASGTLHLDKRLPVAAGIGGGSSDAAAVIRLAAERWGVSMDDPAVTALAEELGADVPVCLRPAGWHMAGIGEVLTPGPSLTGIPIVLANPGFPVPTPAVFKARTGDFSAPSPVPADVTDPAQLIAALAARRNDLAGPAEKLHPGIAALRSRLAGAAGCRLARMSGSGGTCFAIFDDEDLAHRAADSLAMISGWWAAAGLLL